MGDAVITNDKSGLAIAFEWQTAFNALLIDLKTDARRGGRASFYHWDRCITGFI
jgi:hypothetical protein